MHQAEPIKWHFTVI